ncbi:MAG: phosphotransferase enzyme family protein [Rhodoglobus sp.]
MNPVATERSAATWAEQQDSALRAFGLDPRAVACSLLTVSENATFKVETSRGERWLLRLHRPGYREPSTIDSEVAWISALLRDDVISTPPLIPNASNDVVTKFVNDAGEIQHAVMFEFVTGHAPNFDEFSSRIEELGALTAAMHTHSRSWVVPSGFNRVVWNFDVILGESTAWGDWAANRRLTTDGRSTIRAAEAQLRRQIDEYTTLGGRTGLIHGDLHAGNLFVTSSGLSVIDFDDCGIGWYMWDLACALSPYEAAPEVPAMVRRWLTGYLRHFPLDATDIAAIPAFVLMRRIQMLAWMEARAGTEIAAQMGDSYVDDSVRMAQGYLDGQLLPTDLITPDNMPLTQNDY